MKAITLYITHSKESYIFTFDSFFIGSLKKNSVNLQSCNLMASTQLFEETSFSIFSLDEFWGRKVLENF